MTKYFVEPTIFFYSAIFYGFYMDNLYEFIIVSKF